MHGRLSSKISLADKSMICICVSHFPPGTSKWNETGHHRFCHITETWRGNPLRTFETVVELIGHTHTRTDLRVRAMLDSNEYPTGVETTDAQMSSLAIHRHAFHGEWNYELHLRRS